jgi:uncharacterized membrane protein YqjE
VKHSVQPEVQAHPQNGSVRFADLAAALVHDAQRLVGLEVALAKQELKDLAMANAVAAGMVAFGGLLVLLGVLVAIPTLVVVLVPWHWQAAAAWAAAYVLVGLGLVLYGKSRFALRLPTRTLESLKENKEWALRRMKSTVR